MVIDIDLGKLLIFFTGKRIERIKRGFAQIENLQNLGGCENPFHGFIKIYENEGVVCPANWEPGKEVLKPSLQLVGKI